MCSSSNNPLLSKKVKLSEISSPCIYCNSTKNITREHVLPESLGTNEVIRCVCQLCNNGVLSDLDKELVSSSPIGQLAARELKSKILSSVWLIEGRGLMIEASYDSITKNVHLYPQMIFEGRQWSLRGDWNETRQFGERAFQCLFIKKVKQAFKLSESGVERINKQAIVFEPIQLPFTPRENKYPPRIFLPKSINELEQSQEFKLRYLHNQDKREALNVLDKLVYFAPRRKTFNQSAPSIQAAFGFSYSEEYLSRALLKIAYNVLRYVCTRTIINCNNFPDVCALILGEIRDENTLRMNAGLVKLDSVSNMDCKSGQHYVWVCHNSGVWDVQMSLFGGQAGTRVRFKGHCCEDWKFCEIQIPIESNSPWAIHKGVVSRVFRGDFRWRHPSEVIPSIDFMNLRAGKYLQKRKIKTR